MRTALSVLFTRDRRRRRRFLYHFWLTRIYTPKASYSAYFQGGPRPLSPAYCRYPHSFTTPDIIMEQIPYQYMFFTSKTIISRKTIYVLICLSICPFLYLYINSHISLFLVFYLCLFCKYINMFLLIFQ